MPDGSLADSLSVDHLSKQFGPVRALDDVSLTVPSGTCACLVGESGSGKTTLLRCFNRLVSPDAGRVLIGGTDVATLEPVTLRRRIGYVPQDGGLLPHWTVLRNVELVPRLQGLGDPAARAGEMLTLVGLDPSIFGRRWPHELSGGQRQRVAIARALAARPRLLLLDEPFGALDAITRADLQDAFGRLRAAVSVTCVIVTHDLHEAVLLADHIAVLRGGRVEQVATPLELVDRPASPYVERLLARARVARDEAVGAGRQSSERGGAS